MTESSATYAALEEAIKTHIAAMADEDGGDQGIVLDWVLTAAVLPASEEPSVDFVGETSQGCLPHVRFGLAAYTFERAKFDFFGAESSS